jgi:DNA-binding LacI/PurR family transcriptional regulator
VLASPQLSTPAMERAAASTPVAVVTRRVRSATLASITADDVRGAQLAVEHLVALGHRRIALVRGAGSAGARDRERGYERAMARAGLEPWVAAGAFTEEGGRAGAEALLAAAVPPTAICAPNDLAAIGALTAIETAGLRVPGDVSLTGYDNTTLAALRHIALTTIDQPRHELGRRAMERVLDRLEGRDGAAGHVELEPTLVVRETTAPPRAAGG